MRGSIWLAVLAVVTFSAEAAEPKKKTAPPPVKQVTPRAQPLPAAPIPPAPQPYVPYEPVAPKRFSQAQLGFEVLGAGIIYSVHGSYRPIKPLALTAGFAHYSVLNVGLTLIPLSISGLFGDGDHNLEVMAGPIVAIASGKISGNDFSHRITRSAYLGQVGIGYRLWPVGGGFHFRAMLHGIFASGIFLPWPGFSFGYAF